MNQWISEPFQFPEQAMDRGKVLSKEDLEEIGDYARYRDVDGDGIALRTIPGTDHPRAAFFSRGTGHDERAVYSEKAEDWNQNIERLWRKLESAREALPESIIRQKDKAKVGIIAFGSTDPVILEASEILAGNGLAVDYLRVRAIPFSKDVGEFIEAHDVVYVVEINTDGQMHSLLQLEYPAMATKLVSLAHNDGEPLDPDWVVEAVLRAEEETDDR
jgi:2-oxoglutarate ferredoxin oxidoreductase subunit alpha